MSVTTTVADLAFNDSGEDIALRSIHASTACEEETISLPPPPQLAHIHHITEIEEGSPNTENDQQEKQRYPHGLPFDSPLHKRVFVAFVDRIR